MASVFFISLPWFSIELTNMNDIEEKKVEDQAQALEQARIRHGCGVQ